VIGPEDPDTLETAHNLASSISAHGEHAEAEAMQREVHAAQVRVLGEEHLTRWQP